MKRTNPKVLEKREKRLGCAARLSNKIDLICDAVEDWSTATSKSADELQCSIAKVMEMFQAMPRVECCGELFMLATQLFVAIRESHIQLKWLQLSAMVELKWILSSFMCNF